ncbi:MAG: CBS domain-containing protein, partial [Caldilineaceae bacterium]|nr:CBS domain-containing protein [Caldilineaceae bacterium]
KTIAELMSPEVPTALPDASVETVLQALEQNRQRRVVVIDKDRHVMGIITDGDLLRRSQQSTETSFISRMRRLLTGPQEATTGVADVNECAADVMTTPAITIAVDSPLYEALRLMTEHAIKRLPVVDDTAHLIGLLDRASVLRGLLVDTP